MYASMVNEWRGKYRVILVDGPGHGASDGPTEQTFTMRECAEALKKILDAKQVSNAVIAGTSWGGIVAAEFAIAFPEKTQAVVMLNTPFYMAADGASFADRAIVFGARHVGKTGVFISGIERAFFSSSTREVSGYEVEAFRSSLQAVDSKKLSTAVRAVLIERDELVQKLEQVKAPTLVIAGSRDDMYPIEMQRAATTKIAKARMEIVDSKHISAVDQPKQVAAMIDQFVSESVRR
jgi:pimeloyl-ACP methyl ester carboxylesterase